MNNKILMPKKALNFLLKFMDSEEKQNFTEYMDSVYKELLRTKGHRAAP